MKMNKNYSKKIFLSVSAACLFLCSSSLLAQVKIGSNPTVINAANNLEVESTNGNKTVIQKANGNVGIGIAAPTAKLHVAGNQILGQAPTISSSDGTSQVVRDNSTGELKVLETSVTNSFPLTSIEYRVNNVQKDWLANFDTKIPTSDYVVIITGLHFNSKNLTSGTTDVDNYNPLNFGAFTQGGTWRIMADYNGGSTTDGTNGNWTVKCLVINKSIIQVLPAEVVDLGGLNNGASTAPPSGL